MLKKSCLTTVFLGSIFSLVSADEPEIARGEDRNRASYNRYDNHKFYERPYYNNYDENRWETHDNVNVYSEGIIDGDLINNQPNPDVEYTPPGSTDNFNAVFDQNNQY